MFSLFYSIWCNPDTKIYQIVKHLLSTSSENSRTWVTNLRHISKMYNLEDPLTCLQRDPPAKSEYREHILTKVTAFHEGELRSQAASNSKMDYMNVSLTGLRGKHHPSLTNIINVEDVKKLRLHTKFLMGDYLTYQVKFDQTGQGNPLCKLCRSENETISHIIGVCTTYDEIRGRIVQQISDVCLHSKSSINIQNIVNNPQTLTQFILDPSSINLEERIHLSDPIVQQLFKLSRDLCYGIHSERIRKLQRLKKISDNL